MREEGRERAQESKSKRGEKGTEQEGENEQREDEGKEGEGLSERE